MGRAHLWAQPPLASYHREREVSILRWAGEHAGAAWWLAAVCGYGSDAVPQAYPNGQPRKPSFMTRLAFPKVSLSKTVWEMCPWSSASRR